MEKFIKLIDGTTRASYAYGVAGFREKIVNGQRINHVWYGNKQIVAEIKNGNDYSANGYNRE